MGAEKKACEKNVLRNQAWLAKHLRSQDVPFKKAYSKFSKVHAKARAKYLKKRKNLAVHYKAALDHLRTKQQAAVVAHQHSLEGHMLMHHDHDCITKDIQKGVARAK